MTRYFSIPFALVALLSSVALADPPAAAPATALQLADLVGTWKIVMTVNYSNCKESAAVGDMRSEQWNFNVKGGKLDVEVMGSTTGVKSYKGELRQSGQVWLEFVRQAGLGDGGSSVGIELAGSGSKLTGRRVVSNGLCAVILDVAATK